jgi:GMP synthase-like glutamine amidotransferase
MRIVWLQHESFEGPGYILQWAENRGHTASGIMVYENRPLPSLDSFDLLVVMGGPMGVYDSDAYPWLVSEKIFLAQAAAAGKPVLGICLGAQLMADALGAAVKKNPHREIGWYDVSLSSEAKTTALGSLLPDSFTSFHWHGDTFDIPCGAVGLGSSEACRNQGFIWNDRIVGLQFHNEVSVSSIRDLAGACLGELDESRYVQSIDQIGNQSHIAGANAVMDIMLSYMESVVH